MGPAYSFLVVTNPNGNGDGRGHGETSPSGWCELGESRFLDSEPDSAHIKAGIPRGEDALSQFALRNFMTTHQLFLKESDEQDREVYKGRVPSINTNGNGHHPLSLSVQEEAMLNPILLEARAMKNHSSWYLLDAKKIAEFCIDKKRENNIPIGDLVHSLLEKHLKHNLTPSPAVIELWLTKVSVFDKRELELLFKLAEASGKLCTFAGGVPLNGNAQHLNRGPDINTFTLNSIQFPHETKNDDVPKFFHSNQIASALRSIGVQDAMIDIRSNHNGLEVTWTIYWSSILALPRKALVVEAT